MSEASIFASHWNDNSIEREFTESGYECCTRTTGLGHRCGYVALPVGHPLFGMDSWDAYENDAPDVDGGITFAEGMGGKWVFGWDAAHCWHKPDPSIMDEQRRERYERYPELYWHDANAVMINADMAELETRRFAEKLREMECKPYNVEDVLREFVKSGTPTGEGGVLYEAALIEKYANKLHELLNGDTDD